MYGNDEIIDYICGNFVKTMDEKPKITINEVARQAGVSKGTVDRVIHNRGEVSEKSRNKVLKVIKELGYKPNIYASMLASRKIRKIVCLIPEYKQGEFWELIAMGIGQGAEDVAEYGVGVVTISYDQYDVESFQAACTRTLEEEPVGVVLAPMFRTETLNFVRELSARNIAYVYIDSKIEDDGYLAYFGMPMYQSGYLCADMLASLSDMTSVNVIRIDRDKGGLSDPTLVRRSGFLDYMSEYYPDCVIKNFFLNPRDKEQRYEVLDGMFAQSPSKNMVMFNSRIHFVTDYLRDREIRNCMVIGFDVLEKNLAALRDGYVQMLIAQHSDRQVRLAIVAIMESVVLMRPLAKRDNYTMMDLLTKYNCDYY